MPVFVPARVKQKKNQHQGFGWGFDGESGGWAGLMVGVGATEDDFDAVVEVVEVLVAFKIVEEVEDVV